MNAFEYANPSTKEQAVQLLGSEWGETEVLAGGTDLLSLMKVFGTTPKRLVNIKDIEEFQGIDYISNSGLRLGSTSVLAKLIEHPIVQKTIDPSFKLQRESEVHRFKVLVQSEVTYARDLDVGIFAMD